VPYLQGILSQNEVVMANPTVNLRKIKRKKGHYYMVDYTINGKRYRKAAGKYKRDAEAIKAKIQTEITLGNFDIIANEKIVLSLDELILEYINEKRNYTTPKTRNRYTNHLIPFQDFINSFFPKAANNICLIESQHIKECVDYIADKKCLQDWAPVTINRMIELISSVFIYSMKRKYRTDNPTLDVRKLPVPQNDTPEFFSYEELSDIWITVDYYWLPFLKFLYHTGIRKGELINLTWDKINLVREPATMRIVSTSEWKTKTGKSRMVPLNKLAVEILEEKQAKHGKYIFTSRKGNKVHPNTPYNVLKRSLDTLGLEGDVHKLRHTFASHLVMKGANIFEVKELLGHSKIETTMIYAHLSPDHKNSVVNLLT